LTSIKVPAGVAAEGPDDQVVEAVAVHVTRRAHRIAALVARVDSVEPEAVAAIERRQVERSRPPPRLPEHHIALAGVAVAARGATERPDDQVVEAVAVHVPRRAHRKAAMVERVDAVEPEAVAAVQRREVERARPPRRLPEHHVALAGVAVAARV